MKHQNTIITISLNVLFCVALLWFFSRNAFLRPYAGSTTKEILAGLVLLGSLYINYFLLFPKLYEQRSYIAYWVLVLVMSIVAGVLDMAIAYPHISVCNAMLIETIGFTKFFALCVFFISGRNLAFNFFPFMIRERKLLQQALETETQIVYQYARLLDVCDKKNNCQHIPVEQVFYCKKVGNYTFVYMVDGDVFTRYCSIKYLEQHLGNKEFVRISPSFIVPYRHIASCDGETVVMKTVPWMETPLTFKLDTQRRPYVAAVIDKHLRADMEVTDSARPDNKEVKGRRNPSVPPKEKLDAVLNYIKEHPGCRSTELMSHTSYSQTTIERSLSDLKKRGVIEYSGSKKTGGYRVVGTPDHLF